jgi:hypothetical protein
MGYKPCYRYANFCLFWESGEFCSYPADEDNLQFLRNPYFLSCWIFLRHCCVLDAKSSSPYTNTHSVTWDNVIQNPAEQCNLWFHKRQAICGVVMTLVASQQRLRLGLLGVQNLINLISWHVNLCWITQRSVARQPTGKQDSAQARWRHTSGVREIMCVYVVVRRRAAILSDCNGSGGRDVTALLSGQYDRC